MKNLNWCAKTALGFLCVAVVMVVLSLIYDSLGCLGVALISAAVALLIFLVERMLAKKTFRQKIIAGTIPMALIYFIVTMVYLLFFKTCEPLGIAGGILLGIVTVYTIITFVLLQIEEVKSNRKIQGKS